MSPVVLLATALGAWIALAPRPKLGTGSSTVVKGPKSGLVYMVSLGAPAADGRRLHSVFDQKGVFLLTFIQDSAGKRRSLTASSKDPALTQAVKTARADFGF